MHYFLCYILLQMHLGSKGLFEGGGWQYEEEGPWGHLTSFILHAGVRGLPPGSLACVQYAQYVQLAQEQNMYKVPWHTVHKAVSLLKTCHRTSPKSI